MLGEHSKKEICFAFVCKYCKATYTSFPEFLNHKLSQHKDIVGKLKLENKLDETDSKEEPIELYANKNGALDLSLIGSKTTKIKFAFNRNLDTGTNAKRILKLQPLNEASNQVSNRQNNSKLEVSSRPYKSTNCSNASNAQLNILQVNADGTNVYSCSMCPLTSKLKCNIVRHSKTHGTSQKHKCKLCTCTYTSMRGLIFHINSAHEPTPSLFQIINNKATCTICSQTVNSQRLMAHRRECHPEGKQKYFCNKCPFTSNFATLLSLHMKIHADSNQLTCHLCNTTCTCPKALKNHVLLSHSGRQGSKSIRNRRKSQYSVKRQPVLCLYCRALLPSKAKRSQHVKIYHSKSGNYKCGKSLFEAKESEELQKHKEAKHRSSSSIQYKQSGNKSDHVTQKHKETLHQPMVTVERLKRKKYEYHSEETRSRSRNGGKGIVQTCRICAEQVPSLRAYQIHFQEKHADDKPFLCPECPYQSDSRYFLSSHQKLMHSKEEGFKCKHCSACFGVKAHIINHVKLVHGDDTADGYITTKEIPVAIACSMCQDKFPRIVDLLSHQRNVHAYNKLTYSERQEPPGYICYPNSEKDLDLQHNNLDVYSSASDNAIFSELTSEMCLATLTAISRTID